MLRTSQSRRALFAMLKKVHHKIKDIKKDLKLKIIKLNNMPQIIQKGNELIRISPTKKGELDYSTDNGRNWNRRRAANPTYGEFIDLLDVGNEVLAIMKDGKEIYYSADSFRNLNRRYATNSTVGIFQNFNLNGTEILATTEKGLHYSKDNGRNWNRR